MGMEGRQFRSAFRQAAIGELLGEHGVSTCEFAERIGVSHQVVSEYRSGRKTPQLATVLRMVDVFGKDLEFFVERGTNA